MKTKDLQPKYRFMNVWWNIWVKRLLSCVTWLWEIGAAGALVGYPLRIDIELGTIRQYYFKYGFKATFKRCWTYNEVIVSRLTGKIEEEDLSYFGLTERAKEEAEINEEFNQLQSEW